jgi:hypothetical protein
MQKVLISVPDDLLARLNTEMSEWDLTIGDGIEPQAW